MIRLNDIVVKFGDFTALHNINVHVKEGEFFTFLGPSGCGKTTTLRTITGFIEPVSGSVVVKGKDITHVPIEDRNIGIVFQSYALFPTMTVYDNIAFGLKVKKFKKAEIDQKVREIARKVDLSDEQLQKAVSQLSGGQQQRVAIARALVTGPAIICMDEPLSNLDAKLRVQLRNELKKMQKDFGITTIYVTHDQEEALTLSDRIAVFNKGYIEQIGTPNEVYNHSKTEFVCNFIGDINRLSDEVIQKAKRSARPSIPGPSMKRSRWTAWSPCGSITACTSSITLIWAARASRSSRKTTACGSMRRARRFRSFSTRGISWPMSPARTRRWRHEHNARPQTPSGVSAADCGRGILCLFVFRLYAAALP